jgi:DNA-binding IclR family transcriptional regulator
VECIAAPIRDHLGKVIAALSVSGPQKKIGTPLESRVVKEVQNAASLISSRLGYLGGLEEMTGKEYRQRKEE